MLFVWMMPIAAVLVVACILVHYEIMRLTADLVLPRLTGIPLRAHIIFGIMACFIAHTIEVWIFAIVYYLLAIETTSGFADESHRHFLDYLYFSSETYTSLGFGDMILLTKDLRLLAGIEAMIGLVLLAWTASFSYFMMDHDWVPSPRRIKRRRSKGDS